MPPPAPPSDVASTAPLVYPPRERSVDATPRDFTAELNREQAAAATHGDGPLLIIAGAGTGKTRTLVYRVAHLIERGVPARAHPPAHLHPPRRARDALPRRAARRVGVNPGAGRNVPRDRPPPAPPVRPRGRPRPRLLHHGPGRRRRPDAARPRQASASASQEKRFPKKETLHYIYSRHINTERPDRDAARARVPAVPRVHDAEHRSASSPST